MRAIILTLLACVGALAQSTALPVTGINTVFHDGQTFVTWNDPYTGAAGGNYRYDVYRSTSPITDATSLAAATKIQSRVFNNSAQVNGQAANWTQTIRQSSTMLQAITVQGSCGGPGAWTICGTQLPAMSGLAVHTATATASAYYAVITVDITGALGNSTVTPGSNATTAPVSEAVGAPQPMKYIDSADAAHRNGGNSTGLVIGPASIGLPLFVQLHASSVAAYGNYLTAGAGGAAGSGDVMLTWGDSTMGYQEGVQQWFSVLDNHTTNPYNVGTYSHGARMLVLLPIAASWLPSGTGYIESLWYGGLYPNDTTAQPYEDNFLTWATNWAVGHYSADRNRVYAGGQSMGGWGTGMWAMRHTELFAAVFPTVPKWRPTIIESFQTGSTYGLSSAMKLSDGVTKLSDRFDAVKYVSTGCPQLMPVIWGTSPQDYQEKWQNQIDFINAMKACHNAFAVAWNAEGHGGGITAMSSNLLNYTGTTFAKNISYPAFANSSWDDNTGTGPTDNSVAPGAGVPLDGVNVGCINCGWSWSISSDTASTWSAAISNSKGAATVDISPRNTQAFRLSPGQHVSYSTSAGQLGSLTADSYGVVTLTGATIQVGGTLVSFTNYNPADHFAVTERGGVTTTNYPVQIGRPLLDNEILDYPQVGICTDATCSTVSSWLTTQADVKQRWSSGYAKHAILSFYIPSLTANSTVYFALRDQATCNCGSGLSKTQMLDPSYDFDAVIGLTNGISATISARSILTSWDGGTTSATGPIQYWTRGTNSTTVIIADHRNLATCNAHACSANDVGSDANNSFRPEFHVTFWPLTHQVFVRFVGEVVNTETMQNQTADIALSLGSASPATVYTQAAVTTYAATRWTEWHNNQSGQTWTVSTPSGNVALPKETWIGGVPSPVAIDHNFTYLNSTTAIPHYDPQWYPMSESNVTTLGGTVSGMASTWTAFAASDYSINAAGGSLGWDSRSLDAAGGSSWIGPVPVWNAQWLHSFDIRMQERALRLDDLGAALPFHIVEGKAGENLLRTDAAGAGTGVGHVLSISTRPYFFTIWNYAGTQGRPQDNINVVGTATGSPWVITTADEHLPDRGSVPYLLRGEYWYLQNQWFAGSYAATTTNGAAKTLFNGRGPTGAEGGISDSDPRGPGWGLRALVMSSYITPDGLPEKTYFDQLITDFVSIEEGARCGAGDVYSWCASSPRHGSATWVWGYTYRSKQNPTGLGYPPLGQYFAGGRPAAQGDYGINYVTGPGTVSNSGSSTTLTLSDSGTCDALPLKGSITMCSIPGTIVAVNAKSCPTITLSDAVNASTCHSWYYSNVNSATSQFSMDYVSYSFGRAVELGYPLSNLRDLIIGYFVGLVTDPSSNPRLGFNGRTATVFTDINGNLSYASTYSAQKTGWNSSWQALSSNYGPGGPGVNRPPGGYSALLQTTLSFAPGTSIPNANAAWNWVQANVSTDNGYTNNAGWALVPRVSTTGVAPTITTASLPSGQVGAPYTATIAATGDAPITWSISAGTLPSGLTLDASLATISGTPDTAGIYSFTVMATNGTGNNSKAYSVTIAIQPSNPTTPAVTTGKVSGTVGGK